MNDDKNNMAKENMRLHSMTQNTLNRCGNNIIDEKWDVFLDALQYFPDCIKIYLVQSETRIDEQ